MDISDESKQQADYSGSDQAEPSTVNFNEMGARL